MFKDFFFPKLNKKLALRIGIAVIFFGTVFGFVLMPCFINGASMKPTYSSFGFNFCNKFKYRNTPVKHGDIVILRYVGRKYFLKRVIGLEGDTIEFCYGILFRNGEKVNEDYVKLPSKWHMKPVKVRKGTVFVVGDNRSMPIEQHQFGLINKKRIAGAPLW